METGKTFNFENVAAQYSQTQAQGKLWLKMKNEEETHFTLSILSFDSELCKETIDWNSSALPEGVCLKNLGVEKVPLIAALREEVENACEAKRPIMSTLSLSR